MTKDEHLDWLYRLRSEIYVRMPIAWVEPIKESLNEAIKVLEKQKEGHWIYTGSGQECSICHEIQYGRDSYWNYCSFCGAKMKGNC